MTGTGKDTRYTAILHQKRGLIWPPPEQLFMPLWETLYEGDTLVTFIYEKSRSGDIRQGLLISHTEENQFMDGIKYALFTDKSIRCVCLFGRVCFQVKGVSVFERKNAIFEK